MSQVNAVVDGYKPRNNNNSDYNKDNNQKNQQNNTKSTKNNKYYHKKKKKKRERTPEEKAAYWAKVKAVQEERRKKKMERKRLEKELGIVKVPKEAIMKYNIEPIEGLNEDTVIDGIMDFDERAQEELKKFEEACIIAYKRFYINQKNEKAELEYHQEVKKYRKVFNHNIQEITKQEKFRLIREIKGKVTVFQTN